MSPLSIMKTWNELHAKPLKEKLTTKESSAGRGDIPEEYLCFCHTKTALMCLLANLDRLADRDVF